MCQHTLARILISKSRRDGGAPEWERNYSLPPISAHITRRGSTCRIYDDACSTPGNWNGKRGDLAVVLCFVDFWGGGWWKRPKLWRRVGENMRKSRGVFNPPWWTIKFDGLNKQFWEQKQQRKFLWFITVVGGSMILALSLSYRYSYILLHQF